MRLPRNDQGHRISSADGILDLDRVPDGLLVRLVYRGRRDAPRFALALRLWELVNQHFTYRLILDLSRVERIDDDLVEELSWLAGSLRAHSGMLRLCGLPPGNHGALDRCRSEDCLLAYDDQREAIFSGRHPTRTR